jgi:hypothetical protein
MTKPRIKKVNPKWWQCSDGDDVGFGKSMRAAFIKWRDNPERQPVASLMPLINEEMGFSVDIPDCKIEQTVNITYDCPNCRTVAHIEVTQ